jgi:hypothetical protein
MNPRQREILTKILTEGTIVCILIAVIGCAAQRPPSQSPAPTEISYAYRTIIPSETNTAIKQWDEPHYICVPSEPDQRRGKLWVFLPGTGALPDYYTKLTQEAAKAGLHGIALRYPNDRSINFELCPFDNDSACHEKIRTEITEGSDVSKHVSVDRNNSIEGRLKSLLSYLNSNFPDEEWGQYLDSNGEILWSKVVIAGHSQGAGHALYIAKNHRVDHAVSFSWVDVRSGSLAPWLTEPFFQTPPDGYYLFWHQDDTTVAKYQPALMSALDLDQFGAPAIVDSNSPPYVGSHALVATIPPPPGERAHNTHVVDRALIVDENGIPIYSPVWRFLMTLEVPKNSTESLPSVVQPQEAVRMGMSQRSYIDPELYSDRNLMAFADEQGQIWLAVLDPLTGDIASPDGRDIFVDDNVTPLRISFNGPEFGVDRNGWALFYTKDVNDTPQIWRATIENLDVKKTPITEDTVPRLSVLASKCPSSEAIRLLYSWGEIPLTDGSIAWLDEDDPDATETLVDSIDVGARWVDNTRTFTFIRMSGPEKGQIALYDTETAEVTTITNTAGTKSYSYGWIAPEFNEIVVLTVVDNSRIEVYRDTGGEYWECISSLGIPEGSQYSIIASPEPCVAGEKSYVSLIIKESDRYSPAEVWVWGIEADNRVAIQCDDGQGRVIRSDPESFRGQQHVFVYYNVIRKGESGEVIFELFKWDTGIRSSSYGAEVQIQKNTFSHSRGDGNLQYVIFLGILGLAMSTNPTNHIFLYIHTKKP